MAIAHSRGLDARRIGTGAGLCQGKSTNLFANGRTIGVQVPDTLSWNCIRTENTL